MNMAEYCSRWSQQPVNVTFEPIIRGLKSDIFTTSLELQAVHMFLFFIYHKYDLSSR